MPQDIGFNDAAEATPGVTLIASWGGSLDNCYTTLTLANSFITASVVDYSKWAAASTEQKIASLLTATQDLDTRQYVGVPYFTDQSLLFPRCLNVGLYQGSTWISSLSDELQVKQRSDVEKATALQGLYLLDSTSRKKWLEARNMGVKNIFERTGPLADSVEFFSGRAGISIGPEAMKLLQAWMENRRIVRG
mgnify:CR=1 FL=1